jgi:hypothetical protein
MEPINALTDRIRAWFDRTPKAQEAYRRLGADLDTVVGRVDAATSGLLERITPIIDPSREPAPLHQTETPGSAGATPPSDGPTTPPADKPPTAGNTPA